MLTMRPGVLLCHAPAKINLALHVIGLRDDGYHDLDTLVAFADVGDRILICEEAAARHGSIRFEAIGRFADDLGHASDNLVLRAARMLQAVAGENRPVSIRLEKNIPVASGMGGGSADAAATLLGLAKFWQIPDRIDLKQIANDLGSDVAMCLESRMLRAGGRGTEFTLLSRSDPIPAILVHPGIGLSTAAVFSALATKTNTHIDPSADDDGGWMKISRLSQLRNDLETPAASLEPAIREVLHLVKRQPGCGLARMSGSGATCFGIFGDFAQASSASDAIGRTHPHWWTAATKLGSFDAEKRIEPIPEQVPANG